MVLNSLPHSETGEYRCLANLNLYVLSDCKEQATQARQGRQLKIISTQPTNDALEVCLCEDKYTAWLKVADLPHLQPATEVYQGVLYQRSEIVELLPQVIEFTLQAKDVSNYYLWGGTTAPNYDCSGLVQSSFASVGVWLPRDSYQQEAFTTRIEREDLQPGDLIFFGIERVNHVALYLGDDRYIHSSGTEFGNNGIEINQIKENVDRVSSNYYQQLWSYGRVMKSFV